MKKYIFGAVLSIGLLVSPAFTQAAGLTTVQINAILSLLSSFGADQSVINNVQASLTGGTTTPSQSWCRNFNTDLTVGNSGADVMALNNFLPQSRVTSNSSSAFNENTAANVVAFQKEYGILQTGYVGPLTRAKLNSLYGCTNNVPATGGITVSGMSKYTDSDFGFSFWYPTAWQVTSAPVQNPSSYPGGTISKQLTVGLSGSPDQEITIDEYVSPNKTITDNSQCGPASNCPTAVRYYFDTVTNHTWTVEKTYAYGESNLPTTTGLPDFTINTMGGLHVFPGNARFGDDVILPLSAEHFLIIGPTRAGTLKEQFLANTVLALDPSVATPVSTAQQIQTIQAEKNAYVIQ